MLISDYACLQVLWLQSIDLLIWLFIFSIWSSSTWILMVSSYHCPSSWNSWWGWCFTLPVSCWCICSDVDLHDIGKYHMIRPEILLSSSGVRAMRALVSLVGPNRPHPGPSPTPMAPAALFKLSLGMLSSCLSCAGEVLVSSLAMPLPVCRAHWSRPQPADWSPDLTSALSCCCGPTWQPLDLILALTCGLTYWPWTCLISMSELLVEPALPTLPRYCGNGLWLEMFCLSCWPCYPPWCPSLKKQ